MNILQDPQVKNDRVKLPFKFDPKRMLNEYLALPLNDFEYYNVIQLRAPAHLVDRSLPVPPPVEDYADGSWTEWRNTSELEKSPYLKEIVECFSEITTVTLVRLLRLAPYSEVKEHKDPTLGLDIERSVIRLTIPIIKNSEVVFYLNQIPVEMQLGECWYLNLIDSHSVINAGATERVNLTIDMIPNANLKAVIC
ncbi:aspartyl beta-hydroxylase [Flavobacteriales bacterium 33_180_T64]|nr:aspartyl beta-hydroxylase [Flavobacteriales bacterium 33_180_T64]